ncbi:MAG: hypothetical protein OXH86_05520 [Acidimicrobiaceae bacterium]|nr:hypothetical protein [Acidimicrobiaceae bacterium]MDE0496790.1 hypothetical protein [Acidimicrobiaceae bacterium]
MSIAQAELDSCLAEIFPDIDAPISRKAAEDLIGQKIGCDGRVDITGPLEDGTWTMMIRPSDPKLGPSKPPVPPPYVIRKEFAQHIEPENDTERRSNLE